MVRAAAGTDLRARFDRVSGTAGSADFVGVFVAAAKLVASFSVHDRRSDSWRLYRRIARAE